MANIKLRSLIVNNAIEADLFSNPKSFIKDLSEGELSVQGGCGKFFTIQLPNGRVIMGRDKCLIVPPGTLF